MLCVAIILSCLCYLFLWQLAGKEEKGIFKESGLGPKGIVGQAKVCLFVVFFISSKKKKKKLGGFSNFITVESSTFSHDELDAIISPSHR